MDGKVGLWTAAVLSLILAVYFIIRVVPSSRPQLDPGGPKAPPTLHIEQEASHGVCFDCPLVRIKDPTRPATDWGLEPDERCSKDIEHYSSQDYKLSGFSVLQEGRQAAWLCYLHTDERK